MWIIALLFGFGFGGLCEYFRRERELRQHYAKVGTPSASHNSRYVTALELYQAFIDSNEYGSDTNFKLWCEERLHAEERHDT